MYWVPKTSTAPLNGQDVLVWRFFSQKEYIVCKYYDMGAKMDDDQKAPLSGFYRVNTKGKRIMIRDGVSYFMPLEPPKPLEETRAKQYRRGYKAALLRVMNHLESVAKIAVGGEAWAYKQVYEFIEHETRRIMVDGFIPKGEKNETKF